MQPGQAIPALTLREVQLGVLGEVTDVSAGAEGRPGAGQDDDPGRRVLGGVLAGLEQLFQHRVRQGIAPFGPVQTNVGDRPPVLENHALPRRRHPDRGSRATSPFVNEASVGAD